MENVVNFKEALEGLSVSEQIEYYKNYYDEILQCEDYYFKMFPDWDGVFNTQCKLHDEEIGTSLIHSKQMNILTCRGKCHASFRVVFFHYTYRKKFDPGFSILDSMKELWKMFTTSPTDRYGKYIEAYKTLPYPKLNTSSLPTPSDDGSISIVVGELTEVNQGLQNTVQLMDNYSLSCKILNIFLADRNTKRKYK